MARPRMTTAMLGAIAQQMLPPEKEQQPQLIGPPRRQAAQDGRRQHGAGDRTNAEDRRDPGVVGYAADLGHDGRKDRRRDEHEEAVQHHAAGQHDRAPGICRRKKSCSTLGVADFPAALAAGSGWPRTVRLTCPMSSATAATTGRSGSVQPQVGHIDYRLSGENCQ